MSEPQHVTALREANRVRLANAATLRSIASLPRPDAENRAADLLRDPTPDVAALHVGRLLEAIPRVGRAKARAILTLAGVTPGRRGRRIRELTERERNVIAAALTRPRRHRATAPTPLQRDILDQLNGHAQTANGIAWALGRESGYEIGPSLAGLQRRGLVERTAAGWKRT